MTTHFERYQYWLDHDGKTVMLEGHEHKLRVTSYVTVYPYRDRVISVAAEPVDKNSAMYQEVRNILRDDWSTDVLSSPELSAEILSQVEVAK